MDVHKRSHGRRRSRRQPGEGVLSHIPIFARLAPAEQQSLFESMSVQSFEANQPIFWLGDRGDTFYLINRGRVAVMVPNERGEHVVLNHLDAGGFFGEISLLDGGPRTATVRTVEPTELYSLGRERFHAFLRQRPEVAIQILTIMGARQRGTTEALRGIKNPNVAFEQTRTTPWQKISSLISSLAGSQWFTLFHVVWFGGWLLYNIVGVRVLPARMVFDPYPFGLLTLIVSLEAIFLSIFVMVTQNRQAEKDRIQIDLDYQINLKAHTEIMLLARRLDRLDALLTEQAAEAPTPAAEPGV